MNKDDNDFSNTGCKRDHIEDGHNFFELIADVDNISFDISVSNESCPGTMRSIKGATLPALLRRLTSFETTTQSQILTFLLNMKAIECDPSDLIQFLRKRFFLTQSEVDKYAASVRNEIVTTSEHQELELEMEKGDLEMEMEMEMEEGSLDMAKDEESEYWDAHQHWLLQDRSIIGSQFYWHCSAEELSKHEGDRIAEEALCLLQKNVPDVSIGTATDTTGAGASSTPALSTLMGVQAGVLLFLETWLKIVPEDFMLCVATYSSSNQSSGRSSASANVSAGGNCEDSSTPPRTATRPATATTTERSMSEVCPDVLDNLLDFLWDICQDPSLSPFGLNTLAAEEQGQEQEEAKEQGERRRQVRLTPNSLSTEHFPCVSKLLLLVSENHDSLVDEDHVIDNHNVSNDIGEMSKPGTMPDTMPASVPGCLLEDKPVFSSSTNLSLLSASLSDSSTLPPPPHIVRPLLPVHDSDGNEHDRGYYKMQVERLMSGEIIDRENLTSLRMDFFDKFGDDSLSEILEFESEIMSQSQGAGVEYRPVSWSMPPPQTNRYKYATTASTVTESGHSVAPIAEADEQEVSTGPGTDISFSSSVGENVCDSFSFFKSLFRPSKSSPEKEHQSTTLHVASDAKEVHGPERVLSGDSRPPPSPETLPQDVHIITLSSKVKVTPSTEKRALLFVPQPLISSAMTAASMGIRASTLVVPRGQNSDDKPLNEPYGRHHVHSEVSSVGQLPEENRTKVKDRIHRNPRALRSLLVKTLATENEDSFTACMEMYSYFGMMLSAVELRTAQDYVASSDDATMQNEVPSRLFVDPIDRYIIRYNSTDALCSEKISYLVKSSREESELLPIETVREVTPPSADRERTPVARTSPNTEGSSRYMYDADYNNSSSIADQQKKRNTHRKEQRRRTVGAFLSQKVSRYGSSKSDSRRQTMLSSSESRKHYPASHAPQSVHHPKGATGRQSTSFSAPIVGVGNGSSSYLMSSRSSSFSMSEALFGNSQVYQGPSLFLDYKVYQVAANLTMRLHFLYCTIPMLEFVVDYVYAYDAKSNIRNRTPMLTRFRKESEKLQTLFIGEVLVHPDVSTRAEVVIKMIKVAEHLAKIRSHHALMLVVYALHTHAIYRLKSTWSVVHAKLPGRWDVLTELVGLGGNKLVGFFCQRQPRNGISSDIREEMFLKIPIPVEGCSNSRGGNKTKVYAKTTHPSSPPPSPRRENSAEIYQMAKMRLGEVAVPSSPQRRPHLYSSDSNSSLGGFSEFTGEETNRTDSRDSNSNIAAGGGVGKGGGSGSGGGGGLEKEEEKEEDEDVLDVQEEDICSEESKDEARRPPLLMPISMKQITGSESHHDQDQKKVVRASPSSSPSPQASAESFIRVGFHFMTSGQLSLTQTASSTAIPDAGKIASYENTSSVSSLVDTSSKKVDEFSGEVSGSPAASLSHPDTATEGKRPDSVHWQVQNSTHVAQDDIDIDNDQDKVNSVVEEEVNNSEEICDNEDNEDNEETDMSAPKTVSADVSAGEDIAASGVSTQTVDMLMALTGGKDGGGGRQQVMERPSLTSSSLTSSRPLSYRHVQVTSLSLRPPQSGLGEVRSHGLTGSNAFSGIPVASQKPFMPFLNGILQKIIRLNELPNFLRSQCTHTPSSPASSSSSSASESLRQQTHRQEHGGFLWVESPGNSSTDPKLMMINFGKFRSISNLLMVIRSSQLTPFSLHVDFAVQAMLYRNAMYKTEDDIWERSSELE